jgi:hypothetical protein
MLHWRFKLSTLVLTALGLATLHGRAEVPGLSW